MISSFRKPHQRGLSRRDFLKWMAIGVAGRMEQPMGAGAILHPRPQGPDTPPIRMGTEKFLFWDDTLLDRTQGVQFVMHPASRTGDHCLVADKDKPWGEWMIGYYTVVLKDQGIFRMWYQVWTPDVGHRFSIAYAESTDGIRWKKPILGLIEYHGTKQNNLVMDFNSDLGNVWVDTKAPVEARYKMVYAVYPRSNTDKGVATTRSAKKDFLSLATSADGLKWRPTGRPISHNHANDTQSTVFWDSRVNKYVLYTRLTPGRQIGRSESDDLMN